MLQLELQHRRLQASADVFNSWAKGLNDPAATNRARKTVLPDIEFLVSEIAKNAADAKRCWDATKAALADDVISDSDEAGRAMLRICDLALESITGLRRTIARMRSQNVRVDGDDRLAAAEDEVRALAVAVQVMWPWFDRATIDDAMAEYRRGDAPLAEDLVRELQG